MPYHFFIFFFTFSSALGVSQVLQVNGQAFSQVCYRKDFGMTRRGLTIGLSEFEGGRTRGCYIRHTRIATTSRKFVEFGFCWGPQEYPPYLSFSP
jgi:hypothetical protein